MALSKANFRCPHCGVLTFLAQSLFGLTLIELICARCKKSFGLLVLPLLDNPWTMAFKLDSDIMGQSFLPARLKHIFQNLLYQLGKRSVDPIIASGCGVDQPEQDVDAMIEELGQSASDVREEADAIFRRGDPRQRLVRKYRPPDLSGKSSVAHFAGLPPITASQARKIIYDICTLIPTAPADADN